MKIETEVVTLENAILLHAAGFTNGSMWIWSKNLFWNGKAYEKWQVNWWEKYRLAVDQFKAKPEYCAWTFNELLAKLKEKCKLSTLKLTCGNIRDDQPHLWLGDLMTYGNEIVTIDHSQPTAQDVLAHLLIKVHKKEYLLADCNTQDSFAQHDLSVANEGTETFDAHPLHNKKKI